MADIQFPPPIRSRIHAEPSTAGGGALIVCPQNPKSLMLRKLLYVEVTRAKRNVLILSEGNAFEVMISSYMERERNTGLRRALQNCYH